MKHYRHWEAAELNACLFVTLRDHEAEVDRLARAVESEVAHGTTLEIEVKRLREENLALVDAMRDARALLHKPRPRAMAAASLLGDTLTTRVLEMLPKEGEDDRT